MSEHSRQGIDSHINKLFNLTKEEMEVNLQSYCFDSKHYDYNKSEEELNELTMQMSKSKANVLFEEAITDTVTQDSILTTAIDNLAFFTVAYLSFVTISSLVERFCYKITGRHTVFCEFDMSLFSTFINLMDFFSENFGAISKMSDQQIIQAQQNAGYLPVIYNGRNNMLCHVDDCSRKREMRKIKKDLLDEIADSRNYVEELNISPPTLRELEIHRQRVERLFAEERRKEFLYNEELVEVNLDEQAPLINQ